MLADSLRVVLVEAGDLSKIRDWAPAPNSFSNRVSSITNASQAFLKGLYMRSSRSKLRYSRVIFTAARRNRGLVSHPA